MSPGRSSWLLSFADMLSILLCFLVLAYSMASAPKEKAREGLQAVRIVFGAEVVNAGQAIAAGPVARGANYWGTWFETRMAAVPELRGLTVTVAGDAARIGSVNDQALGAEALTALADVLNSSGTKIAVRANSYGGDTASWGAAAQRAQELRGKLMNAGLAVDPQIVVGIGGPALAIESKEPGE